MLCIISSNFFVQQIFLPVEVILDLPVPKSNIQKPDRLNPTSQCHSSAIPNAHELRPKRSAHTIPMPISPNIPDSIQINSHESCSPHPHHHVSQTLTPSSTLSFPFLQLPLCVLVACKIPPKTVNGITRHTTTPIAIQINAFRRFQLLFPGGESSGLRRPRFADREDREWKMGKEELLGSRWGEYRGGGCVRVVGESEGEEERDVEL